MDKDKVTKIIEGLAGLIALEDEAHQREHRLHPEAGPEFCVRSLRRQIRMCDAAEAQLLRIETTTEKARARVASALEVVRAARTVLSGGEPAMVQLGSLPPATFVMPVEGVQ